MGMKHECGRTGSHIGYWWESQKERDQLEDLNIGESLKLR
jgi:hypothetical protein